MKNLKSFFIGIFLILCSSNSRPNTPLMTTSLYNVLTAKCNAKSYEDCKQVYYYDVPETLGIDPCPADASKLDRFICETENPGPRKWDLCKFSTRHDSGSGGSWEINQVTPRRITLTVRSSGSHNSFDQWGGDITMSIPEVVLIDQDSDDTVRLAFGCTRPAGQCFCKFSSNYQEFQIGDYCDLDKCVKACISSYGDSKSMYNRFNAGHGKPGVCPINNTPNL